jgi:hypothetical protein
LRAGRWRAAATAAPASVVAVCRRCSCGIRRPPPSCAPSHRLPADGGRGCIGATRVHPLLRRPIFMTPFTGAFAPSQQIQVKSGACAWSVRVQGHGPSTLSPTHP